MSNLVKNIIISGGGTGGHLFPALAIADNLKKINSNVNILFVGAEGKIEATKVPKAGYDLELLPVIGFSRSLSFKNVTFFFKLFISLISSFKIVKRFKPDVAVGVGGYASGPLVYAAARRGAKVVLQEQNSYPGVTNKLLAKYAEKICVAYDETDKFFPKEKILKTGNPVRNDLLNVSETQEEAKRFFGFDPDKKMILSLGGSGGARSINEGVAENLEIVADNEIQLLWQTGAYYYDKFSEFSSGFSKKQINTTAFIDRMDLAYKAADVVISRAGAGTISELSILKKACILVPSPYVAEDHQSKNAAALVKTKAAVPVKDKECKEKLIPEAVRIINDKKLSESLSKNIYEHAVHNSAERIANEILNLEKNE